MVLKAVVFLCCVLLGIKIQSVAICHSAGSPQDDAKPDFSGYWTLDSVENDLLQAKSAPALYLEQIIHCKTNGMISVVVRNNGDLRTWLAAFDFMIGDGEYTIPKYTLTFIPEILNLIGDQPAVAGKTYWREDDLVSLMRADNGVEFTEARSLSDDGSIETLQFYVGHPTYDHPLDQLPKLRSQPIILRKSPFHPAGAVLSSDAGYVAIWKEKLATVWAVPSSRRIAYAEHRTDISEAAFSPNGKYLLTGSSDRTGRTRNNTVQLLDLRTGKEEMHQEWQNRVNAVAFSRDSQYAAAGGDDGVIRVWNVATRQKIAQFEQDDRVGAIAFNPSGRLLAAAVRDPGDDIPWTGSMPRIADYKARVWDVITRKAVLVVNLHKAAPVKINFSANGRYLITEDHRNAVTVWYLKTGKEVLRILSRRFYIGQNKRFLAATGDDGIDIWSLDSLHKLATVKARGGIEAVTFSQDDKYIAVASANQVRVIDAVKGHELSALDYRGSVKLAAFTPDGRSLILIKNLTAIGAMGEIVDVLSGSATAYQEYNDICAQNFPGHQM